jgi:hypothetical protein
MADSTCLNDQIPTDPTTLAGLLLLAAAVIGQLTPEQADALTHAFEFAGVIAPFLPRGGR